MKSTVSAMLTWQIKRLGMTILLALAILALAACGTAAESQPTTAPPATEAPAAATTEEAASSAAPAAKLAPTFELPNAAGETISLASYAGDKNVVLVFYRGFW